MKIYNTKLVHCRTVPRKNAAINLKFHRHHFLFEITRNIGHKYIVLRCASVKALIEIFEESKKLFSDNYYY